MRKQSKARYHQEYKPRKNCWRQGSLIDEQLKERNKQTGQKTVAELRAMLNTGSGDVIL